MNAERPFGRDDPVEILLKELKDDLKEAIEARDAISDELVSLLEQVENKQAAIHDKYVIIQKLEGQVKALEGSVR